MNDNMNTFIPVYDIHRGVHYISEQCATCNRVMDIISWNVVAKCVESNPENFSISKHINGSGIFQPCNKMILLYFPSGEPRPCLKNIIATCKTSCKNTKLKNICESGAVSYTHLKFHLEVYKMNIVQYVMVRIPGTV